MSISRWFNQEKLTRNRSLLWAVLLVVVIPMVTVLAQTPEFTATPTSGDPPLDVVFTDQSTDDPTGWAWYFGDEDLSADWELLSGVSHWTARADPTSVVLSDGSLVLMGGIDGETKNDVWRSTDGGAIWTQMTANAAWSARTGHSSVALPDDSIVLIGGYMKKDVWRSTDMGASWTQLTDDAEWPLRWDHTSVVLSDGSILLMGGQYSGRYNDVWRSTDNGASWSELTADAGWSPRYHHTSVVMPSDGRIILMGGATSGGRINDVWRSSDGGETWTEVTTSGPLWSAREGHTSVALTDGSIVLMGGYDDFGRKNDIWRSTDGGENWTLMASSAGWSGRYFHTSVALPDDTVVVIGGWSSGYFNNDVWHSQNLGVTWTQVTDETPWTGRVGHTSVSLPNGHIVLMGGLDDKTGNWMYDVWRSTDGGVNWTQMTANAGWTYRRFHTSVAMPDGSIVLMGGWISGNIRFNDVWRSTDEGATWTEVSTSGPLWSARAYHTSVVLPDGSILLMGGYDGNYKNDVWRSSDNGATWTQVTTSGPLWAARTGHTSVVLPDGLIVLMGGATSGGRINDVWCSSDGGETWTEVTPNAPWLGRGSLTSAALPDGSIVLMGGSTGGSSYANDVWRSTDGGATWTEVSGSAEWLPRYGHTSVTMPDGSIILMGGEGNSKMNDVWRLKTAGSTLQNPEHTYTKPGTYSVTLQVYNADGVGRVSKQDYINVFPLQAEFTAAPTSGKPSLDVAFTNQTTGGATGWAWYFGDEDLSASWTQASAGAEWSKRYGHTSVVLPDGTIVLMGGLNPDNRMNDVWRSIDGGATWTQLTGAADWLVRTDHNSVVLPDGTMVLLGGVGGMDGSNKNDVWHSTNGGATWHEVITSGSKWSARSRHSSVVLPDGSIVLMGGDDGTRKNDVWRSTDGGVTWAQMSSGWWSARRDHTSVALPDGSIVLMGGNDGGLKNDVWRSTDNGVTWTQMASNANWSARFGHTSVVLPDGSIVLLGGYAGSYMNDVWRSTDGGETWTAVSNIPGWSPRQKHSSVVLPNGRIVLMGGYHAPSYKNDVWHLETAGSDQQNPVHSYTNTGTYTVTLQAYNATGVDRAIKPGYIYVVYKDFIPLVFR